MSSRQHQGPDWKTVAAQHAAALRAGKQIHAAHQNRQRRRMNAIDAAARGDRTRVRMPRLSGLGSLDPSSQMVKGATYVFHFTCAIGFGIGCPSLDAVRSAVATDANFANPAPLLEGNGGMAVSFRYNGQQSNIVQAAAEMASVIQSNVFGYARFVFTGADGPAVSVSQVPVSTNSDGTVKLSDGSTVNILTGVVTNPDGTTKNPTITTTPPPDNNDDGGSSFDWTAFWEGLGLSAGVGTALAVGLGFLLLRK